MEKKKWGRRIRAFRKLKGYTQVELANKLGISMTELGEVERENRAPSETLLHLVAQELNVSLEELIPGDIHRERR